MKVFVASATPCESPPSLSLSELKRKYLLWRESINYAKSTLEYDDIKISFLENFMSENSVSDYSQKVGSDFLMNISSCNYGNSYLVAFKKFIYRLDCILLDQEILRVVPKEGYVFPDSYDTSVTGFLNFCKENGNQTTTCREKRTLLRYFIENLESLDCHSIKEMHPDVILEASTMNTRHNSWSVIRQFLTYLYDKSEIELNYAALIPHQKSKLPLPEVYTKEEISALERSFDLHTPIGKRDYAMILLASRLKLRASDIVGLLLDSIDFQNNRLTLNQKKGGDQIHLPLLPEVKEAIKDYIDNVRPACSQPYVFLRLYPPYRSLTRTTVFDAVSSGFDRAGVDTSERRAGPHALRSSGTTHMVNSGISYELVQKSLGHSNRNSIRYYARLDIEQLRKCAQVSPAVTPNSFFEDFLEGRVNL